MRDRIKVICPWGTASINYDIKQAQEDGFAEFEIETSNGSFSRKTRSLDLGEDISVVVAEEAVKSTKCQVYGFIVPDHLLGLFIERFPDRGIYRERYHES